MIKHPNRLRIIRQLSDEVGIEMTELRLALRQILTRSVTLDQAQAVAARALAEEPPARALAEEPPARSLAEDLSLARALAEKPPARSTLETATAEEPSARSPSWPTAERSPSREASEPPLPNTANSQSGLQTVMNEAQEPSATRPRVSRIDPWDLSENSNVSPSKNSEEPAREPKRGHECPHAVRLGLSCAQCPGDYARRVLSP